MWEDYCKELGIPFNSTLEDVKRILKKLRAEKARLPNPKIIDVFQNKGAVPSKGSNLIKDILTASFGGKNGDLISERLEIEIRRAELNKNIQIAENACEYLDNQEEIAKASMKTQAASPPSTHLVPETKPTSQVKRKHLATGGYNVGGQGWLIMRCPDDSFVVFGGPYDKAMEGAYAYIDERGRLCIDSRSGKRQHTSKRRVIRGPIPLEKPKFGSVLDEKKERLNIAHAVETEGMVMLKADGEIVEKADDIALTRDGILHFITDGICTGSMPILKTYPDRVLDVGFYPTEKGRYFATDQNGKWELYWNNEKDQAESCVMYGEPYIAEDKCIRYLNVRGQKMATPRITGKHEKTIQIPPKRPMYYRN